MKTTTPKPSEGPADAERLAFLEKAYRHTLDCLEVAASSGASEGAKSLTSVSQLLGETAARLRMLFKFKALAFFLVREPGGEFHLARCIPPGKADQMMEEMRLLAESGSTAWALQRKRPVFTSASQGEGRLLLHSMATTSRIRGMFLGWPGQDLKTISDASLSLLTIILQGCASHLEGLELYGLLRRTNADLKAKVRHLELSERALKREIAQRRKVEEKLKHQALHDPLTGLANRTLMLDRMQQAIRRSQRRDGAGYAVAFLDLDRFKLVNDTLGHDAGDKLLVQAGERVLDTVRQLDSVARFGGDEFVIFLEELSSQGEAVRVMRRLLDALSVPFDIDGTEVLVTGSIGLVFGPVRMASPEKLLKNAGTAMRMAKEAGRNRIKVFSALMSGKSALSASLAAQLRRAVQNGRTGALFIPTLAATDLRLRGFEAIPTWKSRDRGTFHGDDLLELAARGHMAWDLWLATLDWALANLKSWRAESDAFAGLTVTMKISPAHLPTLDLYDPLAQALGRAGLAGSALRLEIAEETLVSGGESLVSQLARLKQIGVKLCVGDFGERFFSFVGGHPSLIESLRIDPSRLEAQAGVRSPDLTGSLASMAQALDLRVEQDGWAPAVGKPPADATRRRNIPQGVASRPLTPEEALNMVRTLGQAHTSGPVDGDSQSED